MPDDPLSAALAEIREREQGAVPGPWVVRETSALWELALGNDRYRRALVRAPKTDAWPGTANGEFIAHARTDLPRLLKAIGAVLDVHVPAGGYGPAADKGHPDACPHDPGKDWDAHFLADSGSRVTADVLLCESVPAGQFCQEDEQDWPCATYEAIMTALTGEENAGG